MKKCLSADQLEVDTDALSDVSSELSFGYEFAQTEVMMKGMGTNGESWQTPASRNNVEVGLSLNLIRPGIRNSLLSNVPRQLLLESVNI